MNIDDLLYEIACLQDDIACIEHNIKMGDDCDAELDEALIRLTDLENELDNLES